MKTKKQEMRVWFGIDWGDFSHSVSVVSETADLVQRFSLPNTPAGFEELDRHLAAYGEVRGIAVEATRNVLLVHLMGQNHPLYLINPKQSKAWRDTDSVAPAKSDARDGLSLARGLAFRHKNLRQVSQSEPAMARLALLCEKECSLIHQRTALVQELKSMLKVYYPAALAFITSWTAPAAWDFLERFPTAEKLRQAREHTVIAFLKGHNLGCSANWKAKVKGRANATQWPKHPQEDVYVMHACGLTRQLKALQSTLKRFQNEIKEAFRSLPQIRVLDSLPGAAEKLTPRIAAIVASSVARQGGLEALRGHTGVAPITEESGKRRRVHIRRMCNKHWRNTMHIYAWCSTRASTWARAFYAYRKAKGDTHSTALRKLADKWLRIIMRMLETNEPYDEKKHLRNLKRRNSPICQFINKSGG